MGREPSPVAHSSEAFGRRHGTRDEARTASSCSAGGAPGAAASAMGAPAARRARKPSTPASVLAARTPSLADAVRAGVGEGEAGDEQGHGEPDARRDRQAEHVPPRRSRRDGGRARSARRARRSRTRRPSCRRPGRRPPRGRRGRRAPPSRCARPALANANTGTMRRLTQRPRRFSMRSSGDAVSALSRARSSRVDLVGLALVDRDRLAVPGGRRSAARSGPPSLGPWRRTVRGRRRG